MMMTSRLFKKKNEAMLQTEEAPEEEVLIVVVTEEVEVDRETKKMERDHTITKIRAKVEQITTQGKVLIRRVAIIQESSKEKGASLTTTKTKKVGKIGEKTLV